MKRFPKRGIWEQINIGDVFGDLWSSFNLALSDVYGKIRVNGRLLVNTETADAANLDVAPFAIIYNPEADDHKWQVGAGDDLFVGGDLPNSAFAEDDATSPPSFETTSRPDLAVFPSVSNVYTYGMAAELYRRADNGASWGSAITAIGGSFGGAPLIPFGATGRLYYRGDSVCKMFSIDNAESATAIESGQYTLNLNDISHQIVCGKASSDFIYLGTKALGRQKARVHKWNGSSTSVSATYEIDAEAVLAIAIKDNTPYLLDSNGVLRRLNGGQFEEIARLPFKDFKPIRPVTGAQTTWLCHYNGMAADKDRIVMNLNTTYADGTTDERVPSGIWEWNERNGLFHRASYGLTKSSGTITDYGGAKVSAIGAIAIAKLSNSSTNGSIIAGATIFTSATATKVVIAYDDSNNTLQKAGSFVTSKTFSDDIRDTWQKFYLRLRKMLNSTDKIIVKVRTEEKEPNEVTITWASTTTLTFLETGLDFNANYEVGDEVEIIQGVGAGKTAHVTAVSVTAGTYTLTLDEVFTGATGTAKARFQKWKKLGSFTSQTEEIYQVPINKGASASVQFRVWLLWTGDNEIHDLTISSKVHEPAE